MKFATYNIWNSERGMPLREQQIINEIKTINSDIICLQEVKEEVYNKLVNEVNEYKYSYYHHFKNEYDGLAIFSKYPLLTKKDTKCAILTTFEYEDNIYLVVNVHLPWDSAIHKERYMVNIIEETSKIEADYAILTGDFNCTVNSSVHHYLQGDRTLLNSEANPCWYDLAEVHASITNTEPDKTLDIRSNPRWKSKPVTYTGSRVDRIYLRDPFPKPPALLESFSTFGKEVDQQSEYCASDHYGVMAEINFD